MAIGLRSQVKTAPVSFSSSGDNIVIAAAAGKIIVVVGMLLVVAGATSIIFKDGSNLLSGAMPMSTNGSIVLDEKPEFDWYSTSSGVNNFIINSSNAVQVSGTIYYVQV